MDQEECWDRLYASDGRRWRGVASLGDLPFPEGGRIIEVGCGNGKTAAALCAAGYRVTAVDFSAEAVEACRRFVPGAECIKGSLLDLPFPDRSFDGAVLHHVMEHIPLEDLPAASRELARVLVPGSFASVRSFAEGDLRSGTGEPSENGSVIRGNGIAYFYRSEEGFLRMFPDAEAVSVRLTEEPTRFGGTRRRLEGMFRFGCTKVDIG